MGGELLLLHVQHWLESRVGSHSAGSVAGAATSKWFQVLSRWPCRLSRWPCCLGPPTFSAEAGIQEGSVERGRQTHTSLKAAPGRVTAVLPPHSVAQGRSQGQPRIEGGEIATASRWEGEVVSPSEIHHSWVR